jgi:hypothetical protein
MNKFLHGFIMIEKSVQIAILVLLMLFLGYLGFVNSPSDRTPAVPVTAPTSQQ